MERPGTESGLQRSAGHMHRTLVNAIHRSIRARASGPGGIGLGRNPGDDLPALRGRIAEILDDLNGILKLPAWVEWFPSGEDICDDTVVYRILRGLGASPEEALRLLLALNTPLAWAATLVQFVPDSMPALALYDLLRSFGIPPLSAARQCGTRARAMAFLGRLGLEQEYGPWIGPGGRLLIQGDARVCALPANLLLRGGDLIDDCPNLEDLGKGMNVLHGPLRVERCPKLRQLPDGFETHSVGLVTVDGILKPESRSPRLHVVVRACPNFVRLGERTRIRGLLRVMDCPSFGKGSQQGVDLIEFCG